VRPPLKADARSLGAAVAKLSELEEIELRHPGPLAAEGARFTDARRLQTVLRFRPGQSADLAEQLVSFLALCDLPELPPSSVEDFVVAFEKRVRSSHGPILAAIRQHRAYSDQDRAILASVARELCHSHFR
jgi:hypothetical protein